MRVYPDLTQDGEFQRLGGLGYSGSLNDRQFAFLRANLYTGALPDMMRQSVVSPAANRNLLRYTEQFDNAVWTKVNLTATLNAGVAPDGTTTADKLLETTATNSFHQTLQLSVGATSTTHTVSVYAKAAERNGVAVLMDTNDGINFAFAQFNLSAGTAGAIQYAGTGYSAGSTSIVAVGDGWYRCTITASRAIAYAARAYVEINNGSTRQYTGNASSGILVWGAQLEVGAFATAYQARTV